MSWPNALQYHDAMQNLRVALRDDEVREGEVARRPNGLPMVWAGSFANVYKVTCSATGRSWALKCFTREVSGLHDRYAKIQAHFQQARPRFTIDFQYLDEGIRVGSDWYPVLKMPWVEGLTLDKFVEQHMTDPGVLRALRMLWLELADVLERTKTTHADLQHGNVLLVPTAAGAPALKLVDYDGMWVPRLAGRPSGELGHQHYQHPDRLRKQVFSSTVDRFSHLVVYTSLRCLTDEGPYLWEQFNNGDNLLFSQSDFRRPAASKVFQTLWESENAEVRWLVGRLVLACGMPLEDVPRLSDFIVRDKVRPLRSKDETAIASAVGVRKRPPPPSPPPLPPPEERFEFRVSVLISLVFAVALIPLLAVLMFIHLGPAIAFCASAVGLYFVVGPHVFRFTVSRWAGEPPDSETIAHFTIASGILWGVIAFLVGVGLAASLAQAAYWSILAAPIAAAAIWYVWTLWVGYAKFLGFDRNTALGVLMAHQLLMALSITSFLAIVFVPLHLSTRAVRADSASEAKTAESRPIAPQPPIPEPPPRDLESRLSSIAYQSVLLTLGFVVIVFVVVRWFLRE